MSADVTRRHAITLAAAAATLPAPRFPHGFLWGAATAGHQVEGQNVNADVWTLEHAHPTIFAESSGDACDSFNRWPEDLDITRALGLNTYRFSLEWARIEPAEGEFSAVMMAHYHRIIMGCRERGLEPLVTFNHFTTPRWFAARGGWENAGNVHYFTRYCETAARALARDLKVATTLNEPNLLRLLRYVHLPPSVQQVQLAMLADAARQCGSAAFSAANVGDADLKLAPMIAGHKAAFEAIKAQNPALQVGVSLAVVDDQAPGATGARDAKRAYVYAAWLDAARASADFVGVQTYTRQVFGPDGPVAPAANAPRNYMGEEIYPDAVAGTLRYVHAATGKPVIMTENGIATEDDKQRAAYIPQALAAVAEVVREGVPVRGYIHWSLLDNFEWIFGYRPKYGLVAVDRQTQVRTVKPSAHVYAELVRKYSAG
jgi:beta-glucosidase